ncbi:hypothetical protein CHS0354_028689 [Potamilus streckersoni]|uniref:Uncharacterized protein n=1 Tax=Potamilus streckersoni TaxID=2493646 RepID=A0AAE0T5D0_9BIVA|nr:hypothetical protein CHS0354_028689 [Potamilus streckersoni]
MPPLSLRHKITPKQWKLEEKATKEKKKQELKDGHMKEGLEMKAQQMVQKVNKEEIKSRKCLKGKKNKSSSDFDVCGVCKFCDPLMEESDDENVEDEAKDIFWFQCCKCPQLFHQSCVGIYAHDEGNIGKDDMEFICSLNNE